MYMDIGMDTGDMILKESVDIGEDETTGELWERLSSLGGKLLVDTLKLIEEGKAPREKQLRIIKKTTMDIGHILPLS